MTIRTPSYLKSRFENGDIPQASDYEDIFDSFLPVGASGAQSIDGSFVLSGSITSNGTVGTSARYTGTVSAQSVYMSNLYLDGNFTINALATTQASTVTLTNAINWVVSANGNNTAVMLASAEPTKVQYVINATVTALKVYPCVGGAFVGTATNAPMSIPQTKGATIIHGTSNTYMMIVG